MKGESLVWQEVLREARANRAV